jgi:hypothetical protein
MFYIHEHFAGYQDNQTQSQSESSCDVRLDAGANFEPLFQCIHDLAASLAFRLVSLAVEFE